VKCFWKTVRADRCNVLQSNQHMNTEQRLSPSTSNVMQMTGEYTQHDTSFVITCEGHLPATRKCHYLQPLDYDRRQRLADTPLIHIFSPTETQVYQTGSQQNPRGRPRPVRH
jgi:hypothetical protein